MATVNVRRSFWDRAAKANRRAGESFEATDERADEIARTLPGYVEVSASQGPEIGSMGVADLRALARERGLKVPAKATKAALLELLGA
jgi:hypothetical protein